MEFLPADYALAAVTLVLAILGLFRGFSGMLAFVISSAAAGAAGAFTWNYAQNLVSAPWQRGGLTLLAALLAFGLARVVVRKVVHGLLAQPSDAILGFVSGVLLAGLLAVGWAYSGMGLEHSNIVRELAAYVR